MSALHAVPDDTSPIERIKFCEAEADRLSAESDALRWEAARLISELLDGGMTQRQVAAEIGKSQSHVKIMNRVAEYHGTQDGSSFDSLYQAAKSHPAPVDDAPARGRRHEPAPTDPPTFTVGAPSCVPINLPDSLKARLDAFEREGIALFNECAHDEGYRLVFRKILDKIRRGL